MVPPRFRPRRFSPSICSPHFAEGFSSREIMRLKEVFRKFDLDRPGFKMSLATGGSSWSWYVALFLRVRKSTGKTSHFVGSNLKARSWSPFFLLWLKRGTPPGKPAVFWGSHPRLRGSPASLREGRLPGLPGAAQGHGVAGLRPHQRGANRMAPRYSIGVLFG